MFHQHTRKSNPEPTREQLTDPANSVDVRDVALLHTLALTNAAAAGERYIANSGELFMLSVPLGFCLTHNNFATGPYNYQDICRFTFVQNSAPSDFL